MVVTGERDRPWLAHYPAGVPATLEYPSRPVYWLLEEAAARLPDRAAMRFFGHEWSYRELLALARRVSGALRRRGLQRGERVGLLLPNCPEYLPSLFGIWMAGGVAVPLNPLMVAEEVASLQESTQCRILICLDLLLPLVRNVGPGAPDVLVATRIDAYLPWWDRQLYRMARVQRLGLSGSLPANAIEWENFLTEGSETSEPEAVEGEDLANILPTGGTTGHPKAVMLTHRNLLSNAWQLYHWTGRRTGEDVILACLPFFHSYGLMCCGLSAVAMNGTIVLHHRFRADKVLRLIEQERPTIIPAVPAMLTAFNKELRRRKYNVAGVRSVISGGAALPQAVAEEFARHTGATVVEGYGLSEASPVTHAGPLDGSARPGTIGLPLPDTDAIIVDAETGTRLLPPGEVGELLIRGPQVMRGYWNNPEATAAALRDGWLYTGDLATQDADGFFRIVDRKKDLIITSGVNVYPGDVEAVLRRFEQVEDVAVFGVPDPDRGELVAAVVVPRPGISFNRRAFDAFARQHLEVHKRPRKVEVSQLPLPRNALGKVLRRLLREKFSGEDGEEMAESAPASAEAGASAPSAGTDHTPARASTPSDAAASAPPSPNR
ncbi:long-chain-fatty-acid--CoA ligase [Thermogemmata fonticola]|uniref:Long-chain fatty acid--CoA ligase n=1 Tax=Thermogemmata fonticola TaxID=2755323 RepID=A0A7V9AD90_9BACT|nr:long-chain fatty acid--CoA ligase [Thermogemmata fonticola]MBA2227572.1 long-chain fatty acid--CoA ligase [Thermogemmata fonticola]